MTDVVRVVHAVAVAGRGAPSGLLDRLCAACADTLPIEGAALTVMARVVRPLARAASDARVSRLEELQYTLGEGPGVAAFLDRRPAWQADLLAQDERWPVFATQAGPLVLRGGWPIRSMLAVPLQIAHTRLGVVSLYQRQSGPMDQTLIDTASIAAGAMATAVLTATAPDNDQDDLPWLPRRPGDHGLVDQAVGMAMVQLDTGPDEALARIRAHAFAHDQTLHHVAAALIAHTLVLPRDNR